MSRQLRPAVHKSCCYCHWFPPFSFVRLSVCPKIAICIHNTKCNAMDGRASAGRGLARGRLNLRPPRLTGLRESRPPLLGLMMD